MRNSGSVRRKELISSGTANVVIAWTVNVFAVLLVLGRFEPAVSMNTDPWEVSQAFEHGLHYNSQSKSAQPLDRLSNCKHAPFSSCAYHLLQSLTSHWRASYTYESDMEHAAERLDAEARPAPDARTTPPLSYPKRPGGIQTNARRLRLQSRGCARGCIVFSSHP